MEIIDKIDSSMVKTQSYIHNGVEYHVNFIVEQPAGKSDNPIESDCSDQSGVWLTGIADYDQQGHPDNEERPDSEAPDADRLQNDGPVPESVRPGKVPKVRDSELSEKDLARRNRRRQVNRECARQARERKIQERMESEKKIKKLTEENNQWKKKFEFLLRKNKELASKLNEMEEKMADLRKTPMQKTILTTQNSINKNKVIKNKDYKEQSTQTYQPGEYSNSNLSRNILNRSYKRRAILLQAVEPQIANKKTKMQFIYPAAELMKKTSQIENSDRTDQIQIRNSPADKSGQHHFQVNSPRPVLVQYNQSDNQAPIQEINKQTNHIMEKNETEKAFPDQNRTILNQNCATLIPGTSNQMTNEQIVALMAKILQPMQQKIQKLTNDIEDFPNKYNLKKVVKSKEIKLEP